MTNSQIEWLGLNTVKVDGTPLTDEDAIAYGVKMFEVDKNQIELKHTGGAMLIRVTDDGSILTLPTFDRWLRMTYGTPEPGTELYVMRRAFGYGVYLINEYPETFKADGKTHEEIYGVERNNYYWYCLDSVVCGTAIDAPPLASEEAIIDLCQGFSVITLIGDVEVPGVVTLPKGAYGVELWEEGSGMLCLFTISDEIELVAIKPHQRVYAEREFSSWGDLE